MLDEATGALDAETEKPVSSVQLRLHADRDDSIIAHRLSTVANADEIIVLDARTHRGTRRGLPSLQPARACIARMVSEGGFTIPKAVDDETEIEAANATR